MSPLASAAYTCSSMDATESAAAHARQRDESTVATAQTHTSAFPVELPGIEPASLPGNLPSELQVHSVSFQLVPVITCRFVLGS